MNLQDSNPSDLLGAAWELIVPIFKEITLKSSEGRTGASVRLRFAAVVQKLLLRTMTKAAVCLTNQNETLIIAGYGKTSVSLAGIRWISFIAERVRSRRPYRHLASGDGTDRDTDSIQAAARAAAGLSRTGDPAVLDGLYPLAG
jgi:hypothetical protein